MPSSAVRFLPLLCLLPVLLGCASTTTVSPSSDPSVWPPLHALEERSRDTDLRLRNGNFSLDVRHVHLQADSTFWITREGESYQIATGDVLTVSFRTRGAVDVLRGAGIGLATGTLVGGIIGFASGPGTGIFSDISRAESAMLGALAVSVITVPVAALIGGLNGRRRIVRIMP